MEEYKETNAVSDTCEDCDQTIWYDANAEEATYCEDEDLMVEHECDPDDYEEEGEE